MIDVETTPPAVRPHDAQSTGRHLPGADRCLHAAFYDDRAYTTLNGTVVDSTSAVGSVLCGNLPPATPNADPINGFNSTTAQRAYGAGSGGNNNVPCTGNFGDAKGLDIWTYNQSNVVVAPLNIVAAAADIRVTKS
jgi:hypothetical protein